MTKTLSNRKIVVTRSWKQASGLITKLTELGAHPIPFPTIRIREPEDWIACDEAISRIASYDWLIFTSFNGVHYFLKRASKRGIVAIDAKIAAVGNTTAEAVRSFGYNVDLVPGEFSSAGILRSMDSLDIKGRRFLLPTSNIGRKELREGLQQKGALVDMVEAYRTVPNWDLDAEGMRRRIRSGEIACITFFSPSAFNFFIEVMDRSIIDDIAANSVALAAMGPVTSGAVRAAKLNVDIQPAESKEDDFVRALEEYFS